MHPGDFGVFIPMFGIMLAMFAVWTGHKQKMAKLELEKRALPPASAATPAQDARLEYLEDRVRVLERIVTDSGYRLGNEIEQLRDDRRGDRHGNRENVR